MNVEFTVEPEDLTAQVRELKNIIYASKNLEHVLWPLLEVLDDQLLDYDTNTEDGDIACPNDCANWPHTAGPPIQWCSCECHIS